MLIALSSPSLVRSGGEASKSNGRVSRLKVPHSQYRVTAPATLGGPIAAHTNHGRPNAILPRTLPPDNRGKGKTSPPARSTGALISLGRGSSWSLWLVVDRDPDRQRIPFLSQTVRTRLILPVSSPHPIRALRTDAQCLQCCEMLVFCICLRTESKRTLGWANHADEESKAKRGQSNRCDPSKNVRDQSDQRHTSAPLFFPLSFAGDVRDGPSLSVLSSSSLP